ncbi:MAG: sugar ABC transporter ATP-binding protein, partial [Firmicutes bacterium]|nr:sugar ABC transporter ATP-binding protein [Candidatus Colivicinus equi]
MGNLNAPLLEMKNIKKNFFGNQVLNDINITLNAGDVLGLCGENGAGKTTLMKILFGMEEIAKTGGFEGKVLVNGEEVKFNTPFDALNAGIGMVHQEFSLIPGFTTVENILLNREPSKRNIVSEIFGERLNTLDYNEMTGRANNAIEKMGVKIDPKMVISEMPVGHKQFTEIARELSKDNLKLLILDEPTAVLTESEAKALLESIKTMSKNGVSVIFVTHRLEEIMAVCNKVVVMRDGYVVMDKQAKETDIKEITRFMVGRDVKIASTENLNLNENAKTIMSIKNLWVDMPGELVRNVNLDIKE